MGKKLSIVTVHSNDPLIFKTIESVFKTVKTDFEYIIVDNPMNKEELQQIKEKYPQITVIENPKPFGYARAMNIGFKNATGEFILPLNPDIIVEKGAIDKLVAYLDTRPEVAILGPKLLNADSSLQFSCRRYPKFTTLLMRRGPLKYLFKKTLAKRTAEYEMHDFDHSQEKEVEWLCGGFLLMRRELFKKLGYIDEFFFLYFDDVDLCRRAHKYGKVLYYPKVQAIHSASYESKKKFIPLLIHIRSMCYYYLKYLLFPQWYLHKWSGWKKEPGMSKNYKEQKS